MLRILNLLLVSIILVSCGSNDVTNELKLSTLIKPNFTFTKDLVDCNLIADSSLLDLESFFSKNINKYKIITAEKIKLSILFPENNTNVSKFIISIDSDPDYMGLENFIDQIQEDKFNEIAQCEFIINQNNGFDIYENNSNFDLDFVQIEILNCQYNQGYNFGTFQITINRFINYINKLDIPYSLSYAKNILNNDKFIWINSFYEENYEKTLIDNWIYGTNALEIKDEFIENATCIQSNVYKSYQLL